jgi:hypothetical protein
MPDEIYIPTPIEIENLQEVDLAPDCFGHWNPVMHILGRGNDINGNAYVCFYTEFGVRGNISNSLKEGQISRTVPLCGRYTSHELDQMEGNYCEVAG